MAFALICATACEAGQHAIGTGPRVLQWEASAPADRIRLGVLDEGLYRVTADEIAQASGLSGVAVGEALSSTGFALRCGQKAIAWRTDGRSLFFYGQPTTEAYAPENVYWLSLGPGQAVHGADAAPDGGQPTNLWFMSEYTARRDFLAPYEFKDRRSTHGTITNVSNFGKWIPASSTESKRTFSFSVALPGFLRTQETGTVLRVSLVSYREFTTPDAHACDAWLNDTWAGSVSWTGEQAVALDGAHALYAVTNGTALVRVRNGQTSSTYGDFMMLDARLAYPRAYTATNGALLCTGGGARTASAGGFASSAIRVWDVTDPLAPTELSVPVTQDPSGLWRATFACGGAQARYALFEANAGCFEPSVSGVRDRNWADASEMPELAIVIPPRRWVTGFDAAAQPLATFRAAQGLRTRLIDAEEIYNAFSDGLVHPGAFQAFCRAGVASHSLRYLLFAGHAGSDYKLEAFPLDRPATFPNYFPLYLLDVKETTLSAALLVPNDLAIGNVDNTPAPEVAVGRFIATNSSDLACMVAKTIQYEKTETWKRRTVVTSGYPDGSLDFVSNVRDTASLFSQGHWNVTRYEPFSTTLRYLWNGNYYESNVLGDLRSGIGLLYYLGHSNDTIAGTTVAGALINNNDLLAADWPFAPVAILLGCRMGRWTTLDVHAQVQYNLAEAGFHHPRSGFTAVLAAAGYMEAEAAFTFSRLLSNAIASGQRRLGDACVTALQNVPASNFASMQHLALLGDPSLVISCDETGRGTSTDWLVENGLTGDPMADLADPDGDGFANWVEYQAGTGPRESALRIAELRHAPQSASLSFTPKSGLRYEVVSCTNLSARAWVRSPWRSPGESTWRTDVIDGDSPLKKVELPPRQPQTPSLFYRVRPCE